MKKSKFTDEQIAFALKKAETGIQVSSLQVVFEEITGIDLKKGFIFKEVKTSELTHPHMGYINSKDPRPTIFNNEDF